MLDQVTTEISPHFKDHPIYILWIEHSLRIGSFVTIQVSNDIQQSNKEIIVVIHHVMQHDASKFKYIIYPYLFLSMLQCNQSTIPNHSNEWILSGPGC